ncbi:MAG TPA: polysaccharide deacetylase family protein [Bacillota bacterium]
MFVATVSLAGPTQAQVALAERHAQITEWLRRIDAQLAAARPALRSGARGDEVRLLQAALNAVLPADASLRVDGIFGPRTEAAVRTFQRQVSLRVDGIVGRRTWQALRERLLAARPRTHTVARGETLASIARSYGLSWQQLAQWNELADPNRLPVGLTLWLPPAGMTGAKAAASEAPKAVAPTQPSQAPKPEPTPPTAGQSPPQRAGAGPASSGRSDGVVATQPQAKAVPMALTFNDGPDPATTPQLLRLLEQYGVKATFFIPGETAQRYPNWVRQMVHAGHAVENRGWYASRRAAEDVDRLARELVRSQALLKTLTGREPRFFRPVGARVDGTAIAAAREVGLSIVLWTNIGAEDAPSIAADELQRWLRDDVYPGAIIMLHGDNPVAVTALEALLPQWKAAGATFLTLEQLLARGVGAGTSSERWQP